MAIAEPEITGDPTQTPDATTNGHAPQASERGLILDSLEIKNFRAFRHLVIPKLGRVNLITGKNGVGKSSLLEALYLYAHSASPQAVRQVLLSRRELLMSGLDGSDQTADAPVNFETLFNEASEGSQHFSVGAAKGDAPDFMDAVLDVKFFSDPESMLPDDKVEVKGAFGNGHYYGASAVQRDRSRVGQRLRPVRSALPCVFLRSGVPDGNSMAARWDDMTLTPSEDTVLQAMRLINPQVQRVAFVSEAYHPLGRIGMVKATGMERPAPMARLGEGLSRVFACALSLTDSRNGFFLVDEIENSLHYSVLPDVWRLIFQTARRLNVQVFATTHSWDCIEAFQIAAAEDKESEGMLIRLLNKNGNVLSTIFDEEDLSIITRDGLEVR